MQRQIIIGLCLHLFLSANAEAKDGISASKQIVSMKPEQVGPVSSESKEADSKKKRKFSEFASGGADTSSSGNKDIQQIEKQLKALSLIYKHESAQDKQLDILLRRASLEFRWGRVLGLSRNKASVLGDEELRHLKLSEETLNRVEKKTSASDIKRLASIAYIKGSIKYEYGKESEGRELYIQSLKLNKNSEEAPIMTLIIAEQYFDEENYDKAINFYKWIYAKLTPYQKALADYKVAWSYLGKHNRTEAQNHFLKLFDKNAPTDFAEDGMKDLAFTLAQYETEEDTLAFAQKRLPTAQLRIKFFMNALNSFFQKDRKNTCEKIFATALAIDKTPVEQLTLLLLQMKFDRREFPTKKWAQDFNVFADYFEKVKTEDRQKFLFSSGADLEDNIGQLFKLYGDTFFGKINSPDFTSKSEVTQVLTSLIERYLNVFPESNNKSQLLDLWMDLCSDSKDLKCFGDLQVKMEKDRHFVEFAKSKVYQRAWIEQINLLDSLAQKDAEKVQAFKTKADAFLLAFPKHEAGLNLRKKIVSYLAAAHRVVEVPKYLVEINSLEPNEKNLVALFQVWFELRQYTNIVADKDWVKYQNTNLVDFQRQSQLQLAIEASDKSDFIAYEEHLKKFLDLKPEKDKAKIAYLNYFEKLIEVAKYDKFLAEWKVLDQNLKNEADFLVVKKIWLQKSMENMFTTQDFSLFEGLKESRELLNILLLKMVSGNFDIRKDQNSISALAESERNYLIGILSLSKPDYLVPVLESQTTLSPLDKKALLFIAQMKKGAIREKFSVQESSKFADIIPLSLLDGDPSPLEKKLLLLYKPNKNLPANKYNKKVELIVGDLRYFRVKITRALKTLQIEHQKSLLAIAKEKELLCADAILDSPAPEGLSAQQIEEYKMGLAGLAREFSSQAEEYDKLATALDNQFKATLEKEGLEMLPQIAFKDWKFSDSEVAKKALSYAQSGNELAALILLDQKLAEKKIEMDEYYSIRTGILLKVNNNEVMRDFLKSELTQAKQDKILSYWRGLKI